MWLVYVPLPVSVAAWWLHVWSLPESLLPSSSICTSEEDSGNPTNPTQGKASSFLALCFLGLEAEKIKFWPSKSADWSLHTSQEQNCCLNMHYLQTLFEIALSEHDFFPVACKLLKWEWCLQKKKCLKKEWRGRGRNFIPFAGIS